MDGPYAEAVGDALRVGGRVFREQLSQAADVYASAPQQLLLVAHCAACAVIFASLKRQWLLCYWIGFFGAFGGGHLSALLLSSISTKVVPLALFASNQLFVTWTLTWLLVTYTPLYSIVSKPTVKTLAMAGLHMLRVGTIITRVDIAAAEFPGVIAAPVVIGTLGGCGGKIFTDFLLLVFTGRLEGLPELCCPGVAFHSASAITLMHYLGVHVTAFLDSAQSKALITTVVVAHILAEASLGIKTHWTAPMTAAFYALMPFERNVQPKGAHASSPVMARLNSRTPRVATPRRGSAANGSVAPMRRLSTKEEEPGRGKKTN
ncbi:unnamed protein product [Pedinophyceae sp. YPF-701]|nr:unnamed protein product [Pedinophyceae sp. YPF-701]